MMIWYIKWNYLEATQPSKIFWGSEFVLPSHFDNTSYIQKLRAIVSQKKYYLPNLITTFTTIISQRKKIINRKIHFVFIFWLSNKHTQYKKGTKLNPPLFYHSATQFSQKQLLLPVSCVRRVQAVRAYVDKGGHLHGDESCSSNGKSVT